MSNMDIDSRDRSAIVALCKEVGWATVVREAAKWAARASKPNTSYVDMIRLVLHGTVAETTGVSDVFTVSEFALLIRKSERQAARIAERLPHFRLGRRILMKRHDVEEYVRGCFRAGAEEEAR